MKFIVNIIIILLLTVDLSAQKSEGTITYNRKTDWISIMSKLPWVTQEDIDRRKLTWGNDKNKGQNYDLFFKDNKSVYTYKDEESEYTYSWKEEKYVIIRDHKKNTVDDLVEIVGKQYHIEDAIPKYKWKILNEIKEVAGYICMKAETHNPTKDQNVVAWFTDAIPFFGGPEGYSGLPGTILELNINDQDAVISATKVDLTTIIEKLPVPKKLKGKKVTYEEYNKKLKGFIKDSMEGRKNPFWRVRF